MSAKFNLAQGNRVDDISNIHQAYHIKNNNILCNVSFENLKKTVTGLVNLLAEPLFFFIEVPSDNIDSDDDNMDVYYLDNCTLPVILAIIERYGDILFNDGIAEFGFGSLANDDEIYIMKYKLLNIYSSDIGKFSDFLDKIDFPKENNIVTVWDVLSETNTGSCTSVESEGENIYDIIENLKEVGMYFSHTTK